MRTTVSIDDEVLRLAKAKASSEGRTLSDLVTETLRARLVQRSDQARRPYSALTAGEGGPVPGVDLTNNASVRELMDGH